MISIGNVMTYGWEASIRGMRNPMNSWAKSDTDYTFTTDGAPLIGQNDLELMAKLARAGADHRKFMRMIILTCDIEAPLYWWKEFDTYRFGVEKNSCSTMHKLASKRLSREDFSTDGMTEHSLTTLDSIILELNDLIMLYSVNPAKSKVEWENLIKLLPECYKQRRTCMISYEALTNMYHARKAHKLKEWRDFCGFIQTLEYANLITGEE